MKENAIPMKFRIGIGLSASCDTPSKTGVNGEQCETEDRESIITKLGEIGLVFDVHVANSVVTSEHRPSTRLSDASPSVSLEEMFDRRFIADL